MPQQDCVVFIDYERDHEAEGENAIGDLADLLLRVCPRVTWIGFERMRRNPLDLMHNELLSRSGRRRASASPPQRFLFKFLGTQAQIACS